MLAPCCISHLQTGRPLNIFAGLRVVQAAFPTGAMWAAAESHAAWMVSCSEVKLYAPSASHSIGGSEDGGGFVAWRRCKEAGWDELPAQVCQKPLLLWAPHAKIETVCTWHRDVAADVVE